MKRKDNWPTTGERYSLPQRDGPYLGKSQERAMSSPGELDIRTVEWVNSDGVVERFRSRQGWYLFESEESPSGVVRRSRGFVAKVPGADGRAVLFDPYTLTVLDADYTPKGRLYEVQDFATSWNVPTGDLTNWYDVVCIDDQTIKINAAAMPSLGTYTGLSATALPHIIEFTTGDEYGNAERNATEKRYFEVERHHVKSWGGAGVTEKLLPELPRTEDRAMTIGARVSLDSDTAWLGQLYHTDFFWFTGTWLYSDAEIVMSLASPYLSKTNVGSYVNLQVIPMPFIDYSSGTKTINETFPATEVSLIGTGELFQNSPTTIRGIRWPWTGTESRALQGYRYRSFQGFSYGGTFSDSFDMAGVTLDYNGSNIKRWDVGGELLGLQEQTIVVAGHSSNQSTALLNATATELFWGFVQGGGDPYNEGTRGNATVYISGGFISASSPREFKDQTALFTISIGSVDLVRVEFSTSTAFGPKRMPIPQNFYQYYLNAPYGFIGTTYGMGVFSLAYTQNYSNPANDVVPALMLYKMNDPPPGQTPDGTAEVIAEHDRIAAKAVSQVLYDNRNSSGFYDQNGYYWNEVVPDVNDEVKFFKWNSIDYILRDVDNEVYITVEGEYIGQKNIATSVDSAELNVIVRIKTRYDDVYYNIGQYFYNSIGLPDEVEIDPEQPAITAIPSPQLRAMFTPLHHHQGDFKGAHYITKAEEQNGAAPAHLFNFRLLLRDYTDLETLNDDNRDFPEVCCMPCNLLEMMYIFLFCYSAGAGVILAGDYYAYPVTRVANYNEIKNTLLANAVRIAVRDGVKDTWTDVFGPDFAAVSEVSLHRT